MGGELEGTSAINIPEDAAVTYPSSPETGDVVNMYTGNNRLSPEKVTAYKAEPYLQIRYSISPSLYPFLTGSRLYPGSVLFGVRTGSCPKDSPCPGNPGHVY